MSRTPSFVIKNPRCLVNGVELTDCVQEAEVTLSKQSISDTSSGDNAEHFAVGLEQDKVTVTLRQNFDAAKVDATLYALWAGNTEFTLEVAAAAAPQSSTNPGWIFTALILDYVPLTGKVGDLAVVKQDFVINSVVSRDVT